MSKRFYIDELKHLDVVNRLKTVGNCGTMLLQLGGDAFERMRVAKLVCLKVISLS